MIDRGTSCVLTHDVVIQGQVAFRTGETVIVEEVAPNPQQPEFKYVVFSRSLQKRFQLSDRDVLERGMQPSPTGRARTTIAPISSAQGVKTRVSEIFSGRRKWVIAGIGVIVIVAIVLAVVFGAGSKETSETTNNTSTDNSMVAGSQTFTNSNWGNVCSSPSNYKGAKVELVGKIFAPPETSSGAAAIQMFADPISSSQNTIVYYYGPDASQFAQGDIIKVTGTVGDQFTGQNAMGGSLTVPTVAATSVVKTDASALITGGKDVPVLQQQDQNGVVIIVDKITLQNGETDVYVRVKNNQPDKNASFHSYQAKLQAGNTQFDPDTTKQYQYGQIPTEILPGVEISGILVFPALGPSIPPTGSIALHFTASSGNYMLNFNPYVFNISW